MIKSYVMGFLFGKLLKTISALEDKKDNKQFD